MAPWIAGFRDDGEGEPVSLELSTAYVDSLIESEGRGRAGLPASGDGVEVVPGLLYRHTLAQRPGRDRSACRSSWASVGSAARLWEQEMRTLERLAGFDHPALPKLEDGGRLEGLEGDPGAAYVRTYLNGQPGDGASGHPARRVGPGRPARPPVAPRRRPGSAARGIASPTAVCGRALWSTSSRRPMTPRSSPGSRASSWPASR